MKKPALVFAAIIILSGVITDCTKKSQPVSPAATATAVPVSVYTKTATAINTATITATASASATAKSTATQAVNTATVTLTAPVPPSATQTASAIITATATQTATSAATINAQALVTVPGGTFTQSDVTGDSFQSTISGFMMGKYQVTYYLWYTVYQWAIANGYIFQDAGREGSAGTIGAAPVTTSQPLNYINWRDAIVWCNAYSQMTGLTPVYCSDSGLTMPIKDSTNGSYGSATCTTAGCYDNPYVNWSTNGYRLPTESEYQYAASYIDGTNWTPYNYASGAADVNTDFAATELVAWFSIDTGGSAQPVGELAPNALGIYDMSGNIDEWCWDWYGTYPTTATINYRGPASGSERVMRGGNAATDNMNTQVGLRDAYLPYGVTFLTGFRFARTE